MWNLSDGLVTLGLAVIGGIVWFSRLEWMTKTNTRDVERLATHIELIDSKMKELDDRVMVKLSNIEKAVARIEGSLAVRN
jgi:hypothetical protein